MSLEIPSGAKAADGRGESERDLKVAAFVGFASEQALAESRARLDYAVRLAHRVLVLRLAVRRSDLG